MRLTEDEARTVAARWVEARYPVVPPTALVLEFSERNGGSLAQRPGATFSPEERERFSRNGWLVSFFCSWDTDRPGLPTTLLVWVDDETGQAERFGSPSFEDVTDAP